MIDKVMSLQGPLIAGAFRKAGVLKCARARNVANVEKQGQHGVRDEGTSNETK